MTGSITLDAPETHEFTPGMEFEEFVREYVMDQLDFDGDDNVLIEEITITPRNITVTTR